jgi:hypothetical protein
MVYHKKPLCLKTYQFTIENRLGNQRNRSASQSAFVKFGILNFRSNSFVFQTIAPKVHKTTYQIFMFFTREPNLYVVIWML